MFIINMPNIRIALLLPFIPFAVFAQPKRNTAVPNTGSYEDAVQVAYDSVTKELSGYVKMEISREDQPKKVYRSCAVMFIGKLVGPGKAAVDYYNSPDVEKVTAGDAVFKGGSVSLSAQSGQGYCNDILGLTEGVDMNFSKGRPYIGCRAVNKPKTYLYSAAVDSCKTRMYLVKGDFIMILGVKENWVNVEYLGKKVISGWVRKDELFPAFR
jgi:hypothetical protein